MGMIDHTINSIALPIREEIAVARPVKTAHSPDYQATICTVAQALFAERGFAGTTIREIAEQTGVRSSLLYHYFCSKEALYLSLLEAAVSELVAQAEHIAASVDTPEEKIRRFVQAFREHFQAHPQRFRLVQRAVDEYSPTAQVLVRRWFSRVFSAFHAITTEGVKQGLFKPLPPPLLSFAIAALLEQTMRLHKLVGDMSPDLSGAYLFEELADLIVALLQTDVPKRSVPVRCGKKRPPSKNPRSSTP